MLSKNAKSSADLAFFFGDEKLKIFIKNIYLSIILNCGLLDKKVEID